jgi:hypothetical protein
MARKLHATEVECRRQVEALNEIHVRKRREQEELMDVLNKKLEMVQTEKNKI